MTSVILPWSHKTSTHFSSLTMHTLLRMWYCRWNLSNNPFSQLHWFRFHTHDCGVRSKICLIYVIAWKTTHHWDIQALGCEDRGEFSHCRNGEPPSWWNPLNIPILSKPKQKTPDLKEINISVLPLKNLALLWSISGNFYSNMGLLYVVFTTTEVFLKQSCKSLQYSCLHSNLVLMVPVSDRF